MEYASLNQQNIDIHHNIMNKLKEEQLARYQAETKYNELVKYLTDIGLIKYLDKFNSDNVPFPNIDDLNKEITDLKDKNKKLEDMLETMEEKDAKINEMELIIDTYETECINNSDVEIDNIEVRVNSIEAIIEQNQQALSVQNLDMDTIFEIFKKHNYPVVNKFWLGRFLVPYFDSERKKINGRPIKIYKLKK